MAKYISGRVKDLKVGVSGYSESKVTLNVVGTVSANDIVIGDGSETGISSSSIKVGTAITMDAASGIISAKSFRGPSGINATFVGDGSGLTGVVGSGSGVIVYDGNDAVGTAGTINFGTNLSVSDISAGVVTVTASIPSTDNATNLLGGFARASELDVSGISTFVGVATFNNGLHVISGITTVASSLEVGSAITAYSSTGSIYANRYYGDGQYLTGIQATGNVSATNLSVTGVSTFVGVSTFNDGLIVHAGITTLSDTLEVGTGITAHAGVITATKFDGNATGLTGTPDIDVSDIVGTALSITGIATFTDAWMKPAKLEVGTGITIGTNGQAIFAGIVTATSIDVNTIVGTSLSVSGMSTFTGITTFNDIVKVGSAITMFSATGIVSATKFIGDGSQLINVSASGEGVQIRDSGNPIGAAGTINFGSSLSVDLTDSVATITGIGTQFIKSESINVSGLSTFVGLSTFNDGLIVTSGITTVGFITANDLSVSGIATATTFKGALTGDVTGTVNTASQPNITTVGTLGSLNVTGNVGIGTTIFTDAVQQSNDSVLAVGILTAYEIYSSVYGKFTGSSVTADSLVGTALSISGIGTVGDTLKVGTAITAHAGIITATKFNVYGGSSSQFLKADGTLDSTNYAGSTDSVVGTALSISGIGTVADTFKVGTAITAHAGIVTASAFAGFKYLQAPFGSTTTFTVTVASKDATHRYNGTGSSNAYLINGVQAPVLTLTPGRTYRFTNDNTGSHPFKFYYEADRTTLYTTGVNFQNSYTEITVSDTTPNVLHYQCTAHPYMGNAVITNSNVVDSPYPATLRDGLSVTGISSVGSAITMYGATGIVSATSFYGSGENLTGIDATAIKFGGVVKAQANNSGVYITGIATISDTLKVGTAITAHAGVITATTFKGALTGNADTATLATNASGLTGIPSITVQDITAEMVSIGGTLTYEDVTNIDSVGLITARKGIHVVSGAGVSIAAGGLEVTSGIATITDTLKVGTGITAHAGVITATKFIIEGSTGFLKADGSINTGTFADGAISDIVDDTTPQLGGDLDGNSKSIHSIGIATITDTLKVGTAITAHAGVITATTFDGDPSNTNANSAWLVTAKGDSSAYHFTGPGQDGANDDDPDLYLVRGQRYIFTHNAGASHPFEIRLSSGGSAYNDGVTNNGASSGNIIFNVQHDAPPRLYYQCTNHTGMVGNIYIVGGPQVISGIITATTFSGSGASLTSLPAANLTGNLPAISGANLTDVLTTTGDGASIINGNIVGTALSVSGICTAATFKGPNNGATEAVYYGDGSNLSGITADGVGAIGGLTVKTEGSTVGTAGSISNLDFRGAVNVIANEGASGVATMTVAGVSTGIGTFSASPGTAINIDEMQYYDSSTTVYPSMNFMEYTVYIMHDTGIQAQKALVMYDFGASPVTGDHPIIHSNEYAIMHSTSSPIVSIGATIDPAAYPSSRKVYLTATPTSGVTGLTTFRILRIGENM